jgi:hypothetical protein
LEIRKLCLLDLETALKRQPWDLKPMPQLPIAPAPRRGEEVERPRAVSGRPLETPRPSKQSRHGGVVKALKTFAIVITAIAAFVGAVTGTWALLLKQPLDEHTEMAKSYLGEISSAVARRDLKAANRVRLEYELYEENWRVLRGVAALVKPITELRANNLSPAAVQDLSKRVIELSPAAVSIEPVTMGAAYFALNKYDIAVSTLNLAPVEPKTLVLTAAAYGGLARDTTDAALKRRYEAAAIESLEKGFDAARNTRDWSTVVEFAKDSPDLGQAYPAVMARKQERASPK